MIVITSLSVQIQLGMITLDTVEIGIETLIGIEDLTEII